MKIGEIMSDTISLKVTNLEKSFDGRKEKVSVLQGISFEMQAGEAMAITGPSGSGKSTLLHLIGTLDTPTAGEVFIDEKDPFQLSEPELAQFRNQVIGFVFQDHHLLPQFSVLENVLIPTVATDQQQNGQIDRARQLLKRVGLEARLDHRPAELSGGERQRVAIARALINRPSLLLCDEPTGNLDHATTDAVTDLLFELFREENNVLIVVTHNLALADRFERRQELRNGAFIAQ